MAKKKRKKRILMSLLFIVVALIGGGMGYIKHFDSLIQRPDASEFDQKNIQVNNMEEKKTGYHNIAIFGVDARNSTLGKGNRSDVIMIASINNETGDVKLISVYRDTLMNISGHGYDKITHAYAFGGPELAISTLNTHLDLDIKDFVTVNFSVMEDIIDMMGGVTVDVQSSEVKWINGYVRSLAREGADTEVAFINGPGEQVLTGSQAVAYTRIRYTAGGDFKRAQRQRTILNAALNKVKTQDLATINSIIEKVSGDIYTNFSIGEIMDLAKDVFSYKIADSKGFPYHVTMGKVYTQNSPNIKTAVDIPTMLSEDVKTLHYDMFGVGSPSTIEAPTESDIPEDVITNPDTSASGTTADDAAAGTTEEVPETAVKDFNPSSTVMGFDQDLKDIAASQ